MGEIFRIIKCHNPLCTEDKKFKTLNFRKKYCNKKCNKEHYKIKRRKDYNFKFYYDIKKKLLKFHTSNCLQCENDFESLKRDRRFCSSNCTRLYHLNHKRIKTSKEWDRSILMLKKHT